MHINKSTSQITIDSFPMHGCYKISNKMVAGKRVFFLSGPYTLKTINFRHSEKPNETSIELTLDESIRISKAFTPTEDQVFTEFKEALEYYENHVTTMK